MAEMKRAAEVLAGLETCGSLDGKCKNCPYQTDNPDVSCVLQLTGDAAALLRRILEEVPGCDGVRADNKADD